MASAEELARLIESTVRAALSGLQGSQNPVVGSSGNKRILDPKGVSRVDTFSGKESQWRDWAFQLQVAVKAMSSETAEIMGRTEVDEDGHKLEDLELEFEPGNHQTGRRTIRHSLPLPKWGTLLS